MVRVEGLGEGGGIGKREDYQRAGGYALVRCFRRKQENELHQRDVVCPGG